MVETVRCMKEQDGPDIMLGGGAELFATASEAGLIDDYRFLVAPMALGDGKRLFAKLDEPLKAAHELTHRSRRAPWSGLEYVRRDAPAD